METKILCRGLVVAALGLALSSPAPAQETADLQGQIEELKKGQDEIRKQLQEIKRLIQQRPAAAPAGSKVRNVVLDLGDNPVIGAPNATVTLVEFTDYQCPFCSRHVKNTHPQIASEYIDTGKIRYVSLDMPLERIHKDAFAAAQAAHCAGDQGRYWEMHDRLFENQRAIQPLQGHAKAIGLAITAFNVCISSEKYAAAVRKDMSEARKVGVSATPSFVVARTDPSDPSKVRGISFLRGARAFNAFKAELDKALAEAGK